MLTSDLQTTLRSNRVFVLKVKQVTRCGSSTRCGREHILFHMNCLDAFEKTWHSSGLIRRAMYAGYALGTVKCHGDSHKLTYGSEFKVLPSLMSR